MGEPTVHVRGIVRTGGHHFRVNEFAFTADGNSDPVKLVCIFASGEKIETARGEFFPSKLLGNVANRDHAAAPKDYTFESGGFVRKAKDAAGRDQLRNLRSVQSEAAFSETEK